MNSHALPAVWASGRFTCEVMKQCWTVGVQDYITRRLQAEHDQIEEDERLVRQYREETQKMRSEIEQLKSTYDDY